MDFDYLIVGSGFAGITIAKQLSKKYKVVLLDTGNLNLTDYSQSLNNGLSPSYNIESSRARMFGGTSNLWSGYCRPFDYQLDYQFNRIKKYIFRAEKILGIDNLESYKKDSSFTDYDEYIYQKSKKNFKDEYNDILKNKNIILKLDHNLTDVDFSLEKDQIKINKMYFMNKNEKVSYSAKKYVLCCGGMENARIPMYFNKKYGVEIGGKNHNSILGKFFCDHPFTENIGYYYLKNEFFKNTYLNQPHDYYKVLVNKNNMDNKNFFIGMWKPNKTKMSLDFEDGILRRNFQRIIDGSSEMFLVEGPLWANFGYDTDHETGIKLSDSRDRFGMNKIDFNYEIDLDVFSEQLKARLKLFADDLLKKKIGFIRFNQSLENFKISKLDIKWGNHHQCTTKLGDNETLGVVSNNDYKFFNTRNLYTIGSNLFQHAGLSNPTFTIILLSIDFSERELKKI